MFHMFHKDFFDISILTAMGKHKVQNKCSIFMNCNTYKWRKTDVQGFSQIIFGIWFAPQCGTLSGLLAQKRHPQLSAFGYML